MQLSAADVLRTFHHDEIALFLGAAFATVGLISIGFLLIRRRFDALLFWLGIFAILYGLRLWMMSGMLTLMMPPSSFVDRLKAAGNFLVTIPAFLFFRAAGFLGRIGTIAACLFGSLMAGLIFATVLGAPLDLLYKVNGFAVIAALMTLTVGSFSRPANTRDFVVMRSGLLVFVVFALWNNVSDVMRFHSDWELYGFAVFIGCLGYVAARRALERDQQLAEIQKELDVAKRIQLSILPSKFPASENFRTAARYIPMTTVAGDFYDFLVAGDQQLGLLIADVSGHGVPAALIASMVKLAASSQRAYVGDPAALLAAMNSTLCGNTQSQYVTAACVHIDVERGEFRYAAAAHPPMLLLRAGQVTRIEENGLMLALFPTASYTSVAHDLRAGDRFVLYTDGIIEAADSREEQFGLDRFSALLCASSGHTHEETADQIVAAVQKWAASQDDDLTVIVCDYLGAGATSLMQPV